MTVGREKNETLNPKRARLFCASIPFLLLLSSLNPQKPQVCVCFFCLEAKRGRVAMEKISGACAMEWSIELEKGLRSKKPGEPIAAIERVAPKLREWSREPHITLGVARMYGMMQGEDRMFANAILLRLADAFRTGNKETKYAIIKVFELELKDITRKGQRYDGMLAKQRVPNYLELLRRVKCVYDSGDVEDRALSLRLCGCWADLVRENADVRYMILTSLQSSDVLEVKASIFAAGCICRLSEDFACIALGMFVDILCSKASCNVKIAAARAFSKMTCSSFIINRAYKAGKNLLGSLEVDEVICEMLASLSKLASKSVVLLPTQVEFVMSFLSQECSSLLNARALKCFCFLFQGRGQHVSISRDIASNIFLKIDGICLLVDSHYGILKVLWKVFQSFLPNVPALVVPEFLKIISVMVGIARSRDIHKQYFSLGLLVEMSCSFKNLVPHDWSIGDLLSLECLQVLGPGSDESFSLHFAHCIMTLIVDEIILYLKYASTDANGIEYKQILTSSDVSPKLKREFQMLFYFLVRLIEEYPELFPIMTTKINSFLQDLVKFRHTLNKEVLVPEGLSQEDMDIDKESLSYGLVEADGKYNELTVSTVISYMCRFVKSCVNVLDRIGAFTSETYKIVTHFREHVCEGFFGHSILYQVFLLHLQSRALWDLCRINKERADATDKSEDATGSTMCIPQNTQWVHHEYIALGFSKEMLKRRNSWVLYKAGMRSACNGLWLAATFSFRKIVENAKSDACNCWLRSLVLLAGAESEIKLLLYPKLSISLISWLQHDNVRGSSYSEVENIIGQSVDGSAHLYQLDQKIARIFERIHTSEIILKSARASDDIFCFQSWFLRLRAKVLEVLVGLISILSPASLEKILHYSELSEENMVRNLQIAREELESMAVHFVNVVFQLKNLAVEYDLIGTSFMDIDPSSTRSISRLSLSCSLLAFCTSFPVFFLKSLVAKDITSCGFSGLQNFPTMEIVQDLTERLWDIDNDCVTSLQFFLSFHGDCRRHMHSRTHILTSDYADNATIIICRFATTHFQHLYERAKEASGVGNFYLLLKEGIQLLSDVVIKWMDLSLQVPRYFFRTRLCVSLELFIFNTNSRCSEKISVCPGTQLSLNLCVQLRNASADIIAKITNIYCILAVRPSDCFADLDREKQDFCMRQAWKDGVMVELNKKLLYFMNDGIDTPKVNHIGSSDKNNWVTSFVCFQPSEKGLGFSSCLLDVSTFPEGTYPIYWQSCCTKADDTCWNLLPTNITSFSIKNSPV